MLEQYEGPLIVGRDVLERGLVLERIKAKAAYLEGRPPKSDEEILREAAENADKRRV